MITKHAEQRLAERGITLSNLFLQSLLNECGDKETAVLIKIIEPNKADKTEFHKRDYSNGDLVILIVRSNKVTTAMFRRSDQPFTPEALKVQTVKSLID